jgi:hypothetical protein
MTLEALATRVFTIHGATVDYALLRLPSGTVVELQPGIELSAEVRAELGAALTIPEGYVPRWETP